MRQWLEEGRVTADALVWREGWSEWRSADGPFPFLRGDGSAPSIEFSSTFVASPVAEPRPSGGRSWRVPLAVGLLLAMMVATGVFLWIVL
jgi:hypothetical protein